MDMGLEFYEAKIYLSLISNGINTAWYLSKEVSIPRTTVYRYLKSLVDKGFVVERLEGNRKKFEALVREKFENLINQKQQEFLAVKEESITLVKELSSLATLDISNYKVLHYRGIEGLKQVTWNATRAKGAFRIFEIDQLNSVIDNKFAEGMRREYAKMPIEFRQLTNKTIFTDFTKVTEHIQQWRLKYLPRDILDIKVETQIYNDVVCMYDYTGPEVFILEIYNQKLADMYKQMFDTYWGVAKNMKIVSPYGAAILEL
jgi:predicted transcriptional regulator